MLRLAAATQPSWAERAARDLDALLLDHAHCERKAAGAAVGLLFRHPERPAFQGPLAALAREELGHFEAVLEQLARRGAAFGRQRPGPYGGRLHAIVRSEPIDRLVDTLLCCAAIEARSCERLGLLADVIEDRELAGLYRELHAAEARHHRVYVELACDVTAETAVRARLAQVLAREAAVLAETPDWPRLHAGGLG